MLLMLTALIWGVAFIAQSEGMKFIGPFTFNGLRTLIGGIVLLPFVFVFGKTKGSDINERKKLRRNTLVGGALCGIVLLAATTIQQYALIDVNPGKAGFMTALYIIIVPVIGCFTGRRVNAKLAFAVAASLIGLYFLCFDGENLVFERGDILLVVSALLFSIHILVIDRFSERSNPVAMSCVQFLVCGLLSILPMIFIERPDTQAILEAKNLLLYAGVLSCGVGYTLQIVGQRDLNPTVASLILSLESVFALLGEFVYGKITGSPVNMTSREIFGCAIVFLAIVLAQLPDKKKKAS